ncbi:MAG: NAD(P)-dependent oxidoreductase [Chthonomonadales bacterium]|nr:NAD(P)-dependent oxidoreductase [Chthonomonadales bacterium]
MRVGVVGLGVMGKPMVERLLATGHRVFVHNRTREKMRGLDALGAQWADAPRDVAAASEVVLTVVTDPAAVEAVSFGDAGIAAGLSEGAVHCDMSTVSPAASREMAERYAAAGLRFVQAPVLGSKRQVLAGELLVFAGGEAEAISRCEPAWHAFSHRIWRVGAPEQAAAAKLACNMLIAHMILGLGQSLLFARCHGVDPARLLEILGASALGAPMFASKGQTMVGGDFAANFYVRHMVKDLTLAASAAAECGLCMPLNAANRELFASAVRQGWGDLDYSAVVKVLEGLNGLGGATPER